MKNNKLFASKIGDDYHLFKAVSPFRDQFQKKIGQILKKNISNQHNNKIVELGFGTGATAKAILSLKLPIKLLAVDNVAAMKSKCEKTLAEFGRRTYELKVADAHDYLKSLKTSSVDGVVTGWMLHNLDNDHRYKILQEVYRALKAGGIFINSDKIAVANVAEHKKNLKWQLKQLDQFVKMGRADLKEEWLKHYQIDEMPNIVLNENKFKDDLKMIGFKKCKLVSRKFMDAIVYAKK